MAQPSPEPKSLPPTDPAEEQRLVREILEQMPDAIANRQQTYTRHRRLQALQYDPGRQVSLEYAKSSLTQAEAVAQGAPPYFARIRGRLRDDHGRFAVDIRVSGFPHSESWQTSAGSIEIISQRAALATLARNPGATAYRVGDNDPLEPSRAGQTVRVEGEVVVEDIEIRNGQVVRVGPRFGEIWQDRVRERVVQPGSKDLSQLWEVLDPEQSRIVSDRLDGVRLLVVDGPAGTGKTVVALHHVALHAEEGAAILFLAATDSMKAYAYPAIGTLTLGGYAWQFYSLRELLLELVPEARSSAESSRFWYQATPLGPEKGRTDDDSLAAVLLQTYDEAEARARQIAADFLRGVVLVLGTLHPLGPSSLGEVEIGSPNERHTLDLWSYARKSTPDGSTFDPIGELDPVLRALQHIAQGVEPLRDLFSPRTLERVRTQVRPDLVEIYRQALWRWVTSHDLDPAAAGFEDGRMESFRLRAEDTGPLLFLAAYARRAWPGRRPDWVLIDEAQAFPPISYLALHELLGESVRRFVLSGDLRQHAAAGGVASWDEVLDALHLDRQAARRVELTHSYRTPQAIVEFAQALLGRSAGRATPLHPEKGEVQLVVVRNETDELETLKAEIRRAFDTRRHSILILAPSLYVAEALQQALRNEFGDRVQFLDGLSAYRGQLAVGSPETALGLEAEVVVGVAVTASSYPPGSESAERLYTLATRARRRLTLIGRQPWPSAVPAGRENGRGEAETHGEVAATSEEATLSPGTSSYIRPSEAWLSTAVRVLQALQTAAGECPEAASAPSVAANPASVPRLAAPAIAPFEESLQEILEWLRERLYAIIRSSVGGDMVEAADDYVSALAGELPRLFSLSSSGISTDSSALREKWKFLEELMQSADPGGRETSTWLEALRQARDAALLGVWRHYLALLLLPQGKSRLYDRRPTEGALWLTGGDELYERVEAWNLSSVPFTWAPRGSATTHRRAAWFVQAVRP